MEKYNYMEHLKQDIREWMGDNEWAFNPADYDDWDSFYDDLHSEVFNEDSVTGDSSGSYTFSEWEAEENLCHNWDLIKTVCDEWDIHLGHDESLGAEQMDVLIRGYLCSSAVWEIVEELKAMFPGKTPAQAYEEM